MEEGARISKQPPMELSLDLSVECFRMKTIIILLVIFLECILFEQSSGNQTESLQHIRDGILSRRVRALIFPSKASVLLTAALTKIIVGGRPSGMQYSLEFDMYIPLPDTVEGWRPNILLGTTTKKPAKPKKPEATNPKRRWDWYRNGYGNHYTYYNPYRGFHASSAVHKTNADHFYKSPWQFTEEPWPGHTKHGQKEVYNSWSDIPGWKLHRGYRERREIFDQLEAMGNYFQLDLKACIRRAMCEFRERFSQQYGQGLLMEDLLGIVLTIPEDINDDNYRNLPRGSNCAHFYAPSCPYRVLDFLTFNTTGPKTK